MNKEHNVDRNDMVIDNATFPFDQYVNKLLVEPPGAQPQRTSPAATNGSKFAAKDSRYAINGINPNWDAQPMSTARF